MNGTLKEPFLKKERKKIGLEVSLAMDSVHFFNFIAA